MSECEQLTRRWNIAASRAGISGSEYVDEPERVFDRVRDLPERYGQARKEIVRLKKGGKQ